MKVGITWNLRLRARQLERGSGRRLSLAAYRIFDDEWSALSEESKFHKWAGGGKKRGEWYRTKAELVLRFMSQDGVVLCG